MTHRGPFQPLPFCDSVVLVLLRLSPAKIQAWRAWSPLACEGGTYTL